jgi:hypothetical protein
MTFSGGRKQEGRAGGLVVTKQDDSKGRKR